jgi:hypothetical protein
MTSRADTAIDLASAEPTGRAAAKLLTALVTAKCVAAGQIRARLELRPVPHHRRALRAALELMDSGVRSPLEELYAVEVEIAHGIPAARRQQPFRADGTTVFEGAVYDPVGVPLTVRLNGATHLEPATALRDRRRDSAAELAGRSRLVFGWPEIADQPCSAASEVERVLRRHGWQGPLLRCARCRTL